MGEAVRFASVGSSAVLTVGTLRQEMGGMRERELQASREREKEL